MVDLCEDYCVCVFMEIIFIIGGGFEEEDSYTSTSFCLQFDKTTTTRKKLLR